MARSIGESIEVLRYNDHRGVPDLDPKALDVSADVTLLAAVDVTQKTLAAPVSSEEPALTRGTLVGRYVVLERLGAGAMGVVYGAYDPELDRKVALKLLRPGAGGEEARARLHREAQALAKLAHPNVVAVHDVGSVGDEVFVAMEYVQGVTLREWLHERPRGWREVVEVFVAVGQGLAAAHDAGLVHRDLKPENIMLGADGRVRVMDFGLARESARVASDAASQELGLLVGTPAYMAPEQWESRPVDARSDQFSFCLALWEAVYGERPFRGATLPALMMAITRGERTTPEDPRRAPGWLRELLERGLAVEPSRRWPNMMVLSAELEQRPDPAGQSRERLLIATLVVATMLAYYLYDGLFGDGKISVEDDMLPLALFMMGLIGAAAFVFRKTLLRNPLHRTRLFVILFPGVFIIASRFAGVRGGEDPSSVVMRDVMIVGVAINVAALSLTPRTWLIGIAAMIPVLAVVVILVYPPALAIAATLALNLSILCGLLDWHLVARSSRQSGLPRELRGMAKKTSS